MIERRLNSETMKNSKFGIFKKQIKMLNLFLEIVTENGEQNIIPHSLMFMLYEEKMKTWEANMP